MNLDELQTVRDRERQTDKLQQLRASFYADAGEFIQQLHTERDRAAERADNPFDSPAVSQLSDEIQTAEQTVEAIYEKRVGKLVKAASFAAADLPAEVDGMTAEEKELFDTLVDDIKQNREHVLSVLAGDDDKGGGQQPTDDATPGGKPVGEKQPAPDEQSPEPAREQPDAASGTAEESGDSADRGQSGERTPPTPDIDATPPDAATGEAAGGDSTNFTAAAMGGDDTEEANRQVRNDGGKRATGGEQAGRQAESPGSQPPNRDEQGQGDGPERAEAGAVGTEQSGPGAVGTQQTTSETHGNSGQAEEADKQGDEEGETPHVERETVRITADVGTFVGTDDREYDLVENDIVQLPATNVGPLLERDVAEEF